MTQADKAHYRKAAKEILPDITTIEWQYCWRAAIPLFMLKAKVEVLRAEPRPNELYAAPKQPKRRKSPKRDRYWGVGLEPLERKVNLQSHDDMHGRARALLRKLIPD